MRQKPGMIEIGKKIRAVRKFRKITLAQLSVMSKINYSNLVHIEQGYTNARILTLKEIARCLDMDVKVFL